MHLVNAVGAAANLGMFIEALALLGAADAVGAMSLIAWFVLRTSSSHCVRGTRGAEVVSVPDFTTLYRFLHRLDDQTIDRAVGETVRRLRGLFACAGGGSAGLRVAVDVTGLAQGAVSTFFVRRMHHHGQKPLPWRHWLKWVVVA